MITAKTATDLAFELAASGEFQTVSAVKRELKRRGYDEAQIQGYAFERQLQRVIADATLAEQSDTATRNNERG